MNFECNDCGNTHNETSTTMRVREGEIRYYTGTDDPADVCPKCGSRCKETTKKTGVPGMSFYDSGSGKHKVL